MYDWREKLEIGNGKWGNGEVHEVWPARHVSGRSIPGNVPCATGVVECNTVATKHDLTR